SPGRYCFGVMKALLKNERKHNSTRQRNTQTLTNTHLEIIFSWTKKTLSEKDLWTQNTNFHLSTWDTSMGCGSIGTKAYTMCLKREQTPHGTKQSQCPWKTTGPIM